MLAGNGLISWRNNEPVQYNQKQRQYFSPETRTFTQEMAKYASDYVEAQVQGIDPSDPYAWQTRKLRMAELVKPTAAIQRDFDDYKMVLFADRDIEYVMPGSKIVTVGSTWLVVNPMNVSGSDGTGVVRRCNAVWNFYDSQGNLMSEPLIVENTRANANSGDTQQSIQIAAGYFNVICQYNDNTRQIDTNTRMILGTAAYRVTGYSDFDTEFTGDYSSVRLLSFTIRFEEKNEAIDDMENHVAGGKAFLAELAASGKDDPPPEAPENGVAFTSAVPTALGAYDTATLTAAYFADRQATGDALTWTLSGADESAYTYDADAQGLAITIRCYGYSEAPLIVTAYHGADSVTAEIEMEGF